MSRLLAWSCLMTALVTQAPTTSPLCVRAQVLQQQEGNPGHRPPPKGWRCTPNGYIKGSERTKDSPCSCHAIASKESGCEEVKDEDRACRVFCFKSSCWCPPVDCR